MKKRRQMKGKMILPAVVILAVVAVLAVPGKRSGEEQETVSTHQDEVVLEAEKASSVSEMEEKKPAEGSAVDKTETVHVQADAQGNVKEITVEARLRNKGGSEKIEDYSTLHEIKNTKGDEEFTLESDGRLLWENHGEDIYYEGKSDEELPVTVKVSYYLDGKERKPQEIAGKSGSLRIHFDYENHTVKKIETDGKPVEMPVPFGVFSALLLPEDGFYNVEVTNGKIVDMEGQRLVLGYAFPGLKDSLKLTEYEPAEELEIPEYVELTADVTDFELDFTATVVTSGVFEDIDTEDLDELDEGIEDSGDMQEASEEMVDGAARLLEGMETFQSYMGEYAEGVSSANDGAAALAEGLKMLYEKKADILTGAKALQEGLESLDTALADISLPEESQGMADMGIAAEALLEDTQTLAAFLTSLEETLARADSFCKEAVTYQTQVEEMLSTAKEQLASVSLEEADQAATEMARSQAVSAAQAALADIELSEDEKAWICDSIAAGIGISGITGEAGGRLSAALETLGALPVLEIPELSIDLSVCRNAMQDMMSQIAVLEQYSQALFGMSDTAESMSEVFATLKEGVAKLSSGSGRLTQGIQAFCEGFGKVCEGAAALSGGTQKLKSSGTSLGTGLGTLTEGMSALKEGLEIFDEEGIQKLADLAGEDLGNLITRVKALKKADGLFKNYSGLAKGQSGSVKFIIETEEIEKV